MRTISVFSGYSQRHSYWFETGKAMYFAGIYAEMPDGRHFCILTTATNASMKPVHNRMPVVLHEDEMRIWLRDTAQA